MAVRRILLVLTLVAAAAAGATAGAGPAGAEPGDPTSWRTVHELPAGVVSAPSAISYNYSSLDVFVTYHDGTTGRLAHAYNFSPDSSPTGWTAWVDRGAPPIPGGLASGLAPSVTSWDQYRDDVFALNGGRMDVFATGADLQLWHTWFDGQWNAWEPLGGQLTSAPNVSSRGLGLLDVFARGTDGQLWHRWWDGASWNFWEPLGGQLLGNPSTFADGNYIEVVARGTDSAMWIKEYIPEAGGWTNWYSVGGILTGPPADDDLQTVVPGIGGEPWAFRYGEGFHRVGALPPGGSDLGAATRYFCHDRNCNLITGSTELFTSSGGNLLWATDPEPF